MTIFNYFSNKNLPIVAANQAMKLGMKMRQYNTPTPPRGIFFRIKRRYIFRKYEQICYQNNCFIPIFAPIFQDPESICFPHGLCGIFISGGATIGKNCTIFHHVTIGSNTLEDSKHRGAPTIGDNVFIGAGAKIIGNVKIGDNVRIGAGAIVVKDIEDNATVVMDNIKIIKHRAKRDNKFIPFKPKTPE